MDALARQALACAAWMAPRVAIPRALLARAARRLVGDEAAPVGQAIARLAALGLVTEEAGGEPVLHRLVAAFAVARAVDAAAARNACGVALGWALHEANETGLPARGLKLAPHAAHLLAELPSETTPDWLATLLNNLGFHQRMRGDLTSARAHSERAVALTEVEPRLDQPTFATRLNNLALVLHEQGDFAGARTRFERALTIYEAAYRPKHRHVATGLTNLAGVLQAQGDLAGARVHLERALAIDEAALGPDHPDFAVVLNNLADVLLDQGDLAGAQALFERALKISEAARGPNHLDTAFRLNGLAHVL